MKHQVLFISDDINNKSDDMNKEYVSPASQVGHQNSS